MVDCCTTGENEIALLLVLTDDMQVSNTSHKFCCRQCPFQIPFTLLMLLPHNCCEFWLLTSAPFFWELPSSDWSHLAQKCPGGNPKPMPDCWGHKKLALLPQGVMNLWHHSCFRALGIRPKLPYSCSVKLTCSLNSVLCLTLLPPLLMGFTWDYSFNHLLTQESSSQTLLLGNLT